MSRISNDEVYRRAGVIRLSRKIEESQALLFGKIARLDNSSPLRQLCFIEGTFKIKIPANRRRGRPRTTWLGSVQSHIIERIGSQDRVLQLIADEVIWKREIRAAYRR